MPRGIYDRKKKTARLSGEGEQDSQPELSSMILRYLRPQIEEIVQEAISRHESNYEHHDNSDVEDIVRDVLQGARIEI